ncbi:MAG: hypothetical protein D3916_10290 [Candidatus Electrothrix sp. MAN1_4]|nr:hypothetical protein [Candidatus Electrothrix sp. MAN1_4]
MLLYVTEESKVNDGGINKALNYARLRVLFVNGDEESLFFRFNSTLTPFILQRWVALEYNGRLH